MKMQNTEIEFVTFDAQDVIMTSPVKVFARFQITKYLATGEEPVSYTAPNTWTINDTFSMPVNYVVTIDGSTDYSENDWFEINNIDSTAAIGPGTFTVTGATLNDSSTAEELKGFGNIIKWLNDNKQ